MADAFGGAESGTQLLARLEGRSSLKNLEPCLFAEEGSPVHGKILLSSFEAATDQSSSSPRNQGSCASLPLLWPSQSRLAMFTSPSLREMEQNVHFPNSEEDNDLQCFSL
nr:DNA repair protein XRCC2 isoform X3 [Taeniopygia guttata]